MNNKIKGKIGEELAAQFLTKQGYTVIETNYRYSKIAEIDIIAKKHNVLHFIEVKTRTSLRSGLPLEAITPAKLKAIQTCAMYYLKNSDNKFKKIQIDAIGVTINSTNEHKIDFVEDISIN